MSGTEIDWNREKEWGVSLYKGEGRIMVTPDQPHMSGLNVRSDRYVVFKEMFNARKIGEAVFEAIEYFKTCPISRKTPKERRSMESWKGATKYRTWTSFLKNNDAVDVYNHEGEYHISAYKRITDYEERDIADFTVKIIKLPSSATAEEMGQAVIDVFQAAEEYHTNLEKNKTRKNKDK